MYDLGPFHAGFGFWRQIDFLKVSHILRIKHAKNQIKQVLENLDFVLTNCGRRIFRPLVCENIKKSICSQKQSESKKRNLVLYKSLLSSHWQQGRNGYEPEMEWTDLGKHFCSWNSPSTNRNFGLDPTPVILLLHLHELKFPNKLHQIYMHIITCICSHLTFI